MATINFSGDTTSKNVRTLSAILAGESTLPRRKDLKAEVKRFVGLAGSNLGQFKKSAAKGDMDALRTIAADVAKMVQDPAEAEAEATPAGTPTGPGDASTGTRGRKSQYKGKVLRTTVTENPRREGTKGHRSMTIIMDAGKKGIAHSEFIEKGGRNNDLGWDIARDRVELADK